MSGASTFVIALLLGAVIGQVPLGKWSDRTDRRFVVLVASLLVLAGASVGVVATGAGSFPPSSSPAHWSGRAGSRSTGLSLAHVADYLDPELMVAAGSRLIIANGLGAATGPILASVLVSAVGPVGLFWQLGAVALSLAGYVVVRLQVRGAVDESERSHFTPLAAGTTEAGLADIVPEVVGVELDELRRRRPVRRHRNPRPPRHP